MLLMVLEVFTKPITRAASGTVDRSINNRHDPGLGIRRSAGSNCVDSVKISKSPLFQPGSDQFPQGRPGA